jgi:arylsulfatase A-like enzyme/cytochrome c-type biogenesis protein CcmH/NrfG
VRALILVLTAVCAACAGSTSAPPAAAQPPNVLLITIDTLRADRVGAYGYAAARTPSLDALAQIGTRFDRAFAAAPITLVSHASILTGRYPPGHGARHNGMRVDQNVPTLAQAFARAGAATAAFVAAFPLDRRFGLANGFATYDDEMPRDADGHLANERPGRVVADRAIAWLEQHRGKRVFLWVHFFEPHAPYGNPSDPVQARRPASDRYDDDVAEADAQAGRVIAAMRALGAPTLVVAAADHGEAFGEHGEVSHSVFTYDTTLRVPLIVAGPGVAAGVVKEDVSLVDVAPTIASLAALGALDSDGKPLPASVPPGVPVRLTIDMSSGIDPHARALYAESFAPLLDFGWAPLRTLRAEGWKYIAAPTPELFNVAADPGETRNLVAEEPVIAADLARRVDAISPATLAAAATTDPDAKARLQALGYVSGRQDAGGRADPKDRRELAARIAEVTSDELQGAALERGLRDILRLDPRNPQANLRLGYVLMNSGRCGEAIPRFTAAIDGHVPGADAHLGRAGCEIAARQTDAARRTLTAALTIDPDNPVVVANLGLLISDTGHPADAVGYLQRALGIDPDLHQARFGLAIAFARSGRRADAAREAEELLRRLPPDAPQRDEVQRLLAEVR